MVLKPRRTRTAASLIGALLLLAASAALAQQRPVAAMFNSDQKRDSALALSFLTVELPASKGAAFPAQIYLSAGDLERAFDRAEFRPDGAIMSTNTDLLVTAPAPATQRVLIDRVQSLPNVMRVLQDQIEARRKQPAPPDADGGVLRIGVDAFAAQLRRADSTAKEGAFPRVACFVATDFARGGAIDRRELFAQDRFRRGIAACLGALDEAGVQSMVLPLMGAASSGTQTNDAMFEGQRVLKECRLINAVAGIALGIHDFAPDRRVLREIGLVQWDQEITGMFKAPAGSRLAQTAQTAYRDYAEQIKQAFRKGLKGEKTTASDVDGSCSAIFNVQ